MRMTELITGYLSYFSSFIQFELHFERVIMNYDLLLFWVEEGGTYSILVVVDAGVIDDNHRIWVLMQNRDND
jgi:hypothetical protein